MREMDVSLDKILEGFDPAKSGKGRSQGRRGTTLTVWLKDEEVEVKEAYDRIQQRTNRKFSSALKELVIAAIRKMDQRTA